jgi:hypothetical protein
MAVKSKRSRQKAIPSIQARKGWMDSKTGLKVLALVSILLAIFEGWQISSFKSPLESILWGLIFGASIWVIAAIYYAFARWIKRN